MTRSCGTSSQNQVAAVSVACSIFRPPFDGRGKDAQMAFALDAVGLLHARRKEDKCARPMQMKKTGFAAAMAATLPSPPHLSCRTFSARSANTLGALVV